MVEVKKRVRGCLYLANATVLLSGSRGLLHKGHKRTFPLTPELHNSLATEKDGSRSVEPPSRCASAYETWHNTENSLTSFETEAEEYLEWTHDRKSVRCKVCQAGKKSNVGGWISRKSLKAHLECQTHEACLENRDSRAKAESVRHEQFLRAYEAPPTIYSPSLEPPGISSTPAMFASDAIDSVGEMDVDVQPSITHMMSEFGQTQPEAELSSVERQALLQREFERILTSALQEAHLGGNSEVPLIIEDPLDADSDEDDGCVDLDAVEESHYFPYPNKTVSNNLAPRTTTD